IYTTILNELDARTEMAPDFLKIMVYPQTIIATLFIQHQLQLIQSFSFETKEDICFYLLSILKEYQLSPEQTHLEMSGFIEPHGELHQYIQQLFPKRSFADTDISMLMPQMLESHHAHYFTPFFNPIV
ncbi:MAG: DUF3822 family protein, partial [Chitinophagaceae bacterium]|nr:DUF3822 family protein [Chitinophagaceae bacterium]